MYNTFLLHWYWCYLRKSKQDDKPPTLEAWKSLKRIWNGFSCNQGCKFSYCVCSFFFLETTLAAIWIVIFICRSRSTLHMIHVVKHIKLFQSNENMSPFTSLSNAPIQSCQHYVLQCCRPRFGIMLIEESFNRTRIMTITAGLCT